MDLKPIGNIKSPVVEVLDEGWDIFLFEDWVALNDALEYGFRHGYSQLQRFDNEAHQVRIHHSYQGIQAGKLDGLDQLRDAIGGAFGLGQYFPDRLGLEAAELLAQRVVQVA